MKQLKKLLAFALVLCLVFAQLPVAFAAEAVYGEKTVTIAAGVTAEYEFKNIFATDGTTYEVTVSGAAGFTVSNGTDSVSDTDGVATLGGLVLSSGKATFTIANNTDIEQDYLVQFNEVMPYVVADQVLVVGDNSLTLDSSAETTIYAFEPTETGVYTFTAPEGAVVGYWGGGTWSLTNPGSTSNTCEWTCTAVGQSAYIGVSGVESCTLNVAKTGEYVYNPIEYTIYENTHTPDEKYTKCYTVGAVATATPVKGDDGFYYIGEELVVANFAASTISLSGMLGSGAAKYIEYAEDGTVAKAIDYTAALSAYNDVSGTTYPLTDDLVEMLQNICAAKGWVESEYVTSWLDLCNTATVSHTAGEPVEEDGYTNTYCTVCGALVSSEAPAVPVDIYAGGANVEVAAGKTADCNLWFNGTLNMTVAGEGDFTVTYNGKEYAAVDGVVTISGVSSSYWTPATMQITNNGAADATYAVSFAEPVGSMNNPAELVIGENAAEIAANSSQGYFYTWTAEASGVLYIEMPEGAWFYTINNLTAGTYGDGQWSDSDPVVNPGSVTVSAGDVIQVIVNTYDPADMWNTPAGTLVITAAFECSHANVVHMDAVEPGCHYDGNIEYWICYDCEQVWQDKDLTQLTNIKNVVLPATGEGNVVHFDAVAPGCHYDGNIEYWVCYNCEQVWQDEALTQLTNIKNVVLPATGSDKLVHVEAVAPTCTENGNVEYWYCSECEGYWLDEALTQVTNSKSVILPATGHSYGEDDVCDVCGHDRSNPQTGDNMIVVAAAVAVISMMAVVALPVAKKKFF